jgi:hypothetical protein
MLPCVDERSASAFTGQRPCFCGVRGRGLTSTGIIPFNW